MKDLIYFIPVGLLIALGFAIPRVVKIGDIVCLSQNGACSSFVEEQTKKTKGMSVVSAKEYLDKVFGKEVRVVSFTAKFRLPNKLVVWVVERKPIAAVRVGDSKTYMLVDKDGKVLGTQTEVGLPIIVILGKADEKAVSYAANLMYDLFSIYQVKLGNLKDDGSLEVNNINGKTVVFPLEGEEDVIIGSLRLILSGLKVNPEASRIRLIDLRFKNPVLKT